MLLHADAMDAEQYVAPGSADLVILDPPYGLGSDTLTLEDVSYSKPVHEWDTFESTEEQSAYYSRLIDVIAPLVSAHGSIVIFGSLHGIFLLGSEVQHRDWKLINTIIWLKSNAMYRVVAPGLIESTEYMIWTAPRQKYYYNADLAKRMNDGKQMRNVWSSPMTPLRERVGHPHQKPEWLYRRLIQLMCPPGGHVVDLMCGSGTTAVVCEALGCAYTCLECDEYYFQMAERRLKAARLSLPANNQAACAT